MQFRGRIRLSIRFFEGNFCRIFKYPFLCTKIRHPDGSILVFVKEVINTMYDCNNLMEMQQRYGAEERKIVGGVKTLIQMIFHS